MLGGYRRFFCDAFGGEEEASMPIEQKMALTTFIFSAILTCEALLLSAFGSIYSAYVSYVTKGAAEICNTIRRLCYVITLTMMLASATNIYISTIAMPYIHEALPFVVYVLWVFIILINVPTMVISLRLYNDAST